jgi:hypothetical protein
MAEQKRQLDEKVMQQREKASSSRGSTPASAISASVSEIPEPAHSAELETKVTPAANELPETGAMKHAAAAAAGAKRPAKSRDVAAELELIKAEGELHDEMAIKHILDEAVHKPNAAAMMEHILQVRQQNQRLANTIMSTYLASIEKVHADTQSTTPTMQFETVIWEQQQRTEMAANYTKQVQPPKRMHNRGAQTESVIVIDDNLNDKAGFGRNDSPSETAAAMPAPPEKESRWRLLDSVVMAEFAHRPPKSLLWLLRTIRAIYDDKYTADAVDNRLQQPHDPLPEFVYTWLFSRYGLKSLADQAYWDLNHTMRRYRRENAEVQLFGLLMEEELSVEVLSFYLFCRALIEEDRAKTPPNRTSNRETTTFMVNHPMATQKAVDIINRIYGPANQASLDKLKLDVVSLSYSTAEGSELVDVHKLLHRLCCDFGVRLEEYQMHLADAFKAADQDRDGLINRNEFLDLVKRELPFWPRGKIAEIHSAMKQYVLQGMDMINLKQFLAATEAYEFFYHKLALPFYTNENEALTKAHVEVLGSVFSTNSTKALKPIFLSKLSAKVQHFAQAPHRPTDNSKQVSQVASSVSAILRDGVTEPGREKIEKLLQRFGPEALTNISGGRSSAQQESSSTKPSYQRPKGKRYQIAPSLNPL